jgi:SAM-dependent methyltransferase
MAPRPQREDEALTGAGQRANYATDQHLAERQSIFRYVDREQSSGGRPIDRVPIGINQRVIDVGCGNGVWLGELASAERVGWAAGIDASRAMVLAARQNSPAIPVVQADAQALPLAAGVIDGLLAMHMLYHVVNLALTLRELRRVLAPDGWLLATTNSAVPTLADRLYTDAISAVVGRPVDYILPPLSFNGENGAEQLSQVFGDVAPSTHVTGIRVPEPEVLLPVLDSIRGPIEMTIGRRLEWEAVHDEVVRRAAAIIEEQGAFCYEYRATSFICRP